MKYYARMVKPALTTRWRIPPEARIVFGVGTLDGLQLAAGAAKWAAAYRCAGLNAGDRVIFALEPSPAFLFAFFGAVAASLTIALAKPQEDFSPLVAELCAAAVIARVTGPMHFAPGADDLPAALPALGKRDFPSTPAVRLLARTSGTIAAPRWIALSDGNLFSVVDSHQPWLGLRDAVVLSVLPWQHTFGLVIDLLPAIFSGATVVREPSSGRDPAAMVGIAKRHGVTHISMVPLQARRLFYASETLLAGLRGGVIGGAAVTGDVAAILNRTRLRVGYGQTEGSPGICLGKPGVFTPRGIGEPLGCEIRIVADQTLAFRGPNACVGEWREGRLERFESGRWVNTGDLVRADGDSLTFVGRKGFDFKLSNGWWVHAAEHEYAIEREYPQVEHAVLVSLDGEVLDLYLAVNDLRVTVDVETLRGVLGPLGKKLRRVMAHPVGRLPVTLKGTPDRQRVLEILRGAAALAGT